MNRNAAEIIRHLEARIARLERQSSNVLYKGQDGKFHYMTEVSDLVAKQWNILHPDDPVRRNQVENLFHRIGIGGHVKVQLFNILLEEGSSTPTGEKGLRIIFEPSLYDLPQMPGTVAFQLAYDERHSMRISQS